MDVYNEMEVYPTDGSESIEELDRSARYSKGEVPPSVQGSRVACR